MRLYRFPKEATRNKDVGVVEDGHHHVQQHHEDADVVEREEHGPHDAVGVLPGGKTDGAAVFGAPPKRAARAPRIAGGKGADGRAVGAIAG